MTLEDKYENLRELIRALGGAAVAFSGGVDSSFLCKVIRDVLGDHSLAVTVVSPMLPRSEIECAKEVAVAVGIRHVLVEDPDIEATVAANPADRCYHCKKIEFSHILKAARENGLNRVLDGSNLDDLSDYRPGLIALKELGILSPLREAELTKADIRELSKRLGLKTWNKPAFACLASRIPYGERITLAKLRAVEQAEDFLRLRGFRQFRVRIHGTIARIELAPEERTKMFDTRLMGRRFGASEIPGLPLRLPGTRRLQDGESQQDDKKTRSSECLKKFSTTTASPASPAT